MMKDFDYSVTKEEAEWWTIAALSQPANFFIRD